MLNLLLAVLFTVTWLVGFRLFKTYKINTFQAVVINYWTCAFTGLFTFDISNSLNINTLSQFWVLLAALLGGMFISTFYLTAIATQKIGLTLTTVSAKISLVVPVLFSLFVFQSSQKNFDFINYLGVLLALLAIVFSSLKKEEDTPVARDLLSILFPILIFATNGAVDTMVNYLNWQYVRPENSAFFSIVSFVAAASLGLVGLLYQIFVKGEGLAVKNILGGVAIGVPNFFSFYFLLLALADFKSDGAFLYPIFNILTILFSAIFAWFLFREKLSQLNRIGIGLAVVAMILIAYQEILAKIG
jgi:multidrug transporter EmrE-like cation transporter